MPQMHILSLRETQEDMDEIASPGYVLKPWNLIRNSTAERPLRSCRRTLR